MASVSSFYSTVVNDVVESLKRQFEEEGLDLAALQDLKDIWEKKIRESGALDPPPKQQNPQPATQFSALMNPGTSENRNMTRIGLNNCNSARLIKPCGQNPDQQPQQPSFNAPRISVPVILQGNASHPMAMSRNYPCLNGMNYNNKPNRFSSDFLYEQWLNMDRSKMPMMINTNQGQGVALFQQYQNLVPQPNMQYIHPDTTSNIVNLKKNQLDGNDDDSSDDDFIPVSEGDPKSVQVMSNMPPIKNEDDSEEEEEEVMPPAKLLAHDAAKLGIQPVDDDESESESESEESVDEDPLNSDDDVSDDDPEKIFECGNVIVCQFDKVNRTRNKWKLNFVSGIANLEGRDTVFHKAVGEADW